MLLSKTFNKISNNMSAPLIAISLMIISGLFFVLMHSAVKYLSKEVHIFEIAFFRCALVIFVLAPIIIQQGKTIFKTKQPKMQFLRIITNSVAMLCFFYGISTTPLAQLTTLGFTVPIFATILAVIFMKEKIRLRRTTALIIGFIGTIVVMRPDISIELGALLIIFSSFLWSICLIFIKKLTQTDSAVTISLYFGIGMIPATFILAFPVMEAIDMRQFTILVFIAITGTLAQTIMNTALKKGELALLLPFDFLRLIWSVLIGYVLFAEEPTFTLWIGGFLIIGSTTYIAWREAKLKNQPPL
ncbi:DMT family transporter [Candidatus Levibacter sp. Uisw_134_01]|uniref:DMT family transporter n=1 Tax=Candidatus Levibacter sp. Uisw_134_01 TaxID=3230999 RepID=UPI003D4C5B32